MKPKVYLAGKIGVRDWRWSVGNYADNYVRDPFRYDRYQDPKSAQWDVIEGDGIDITGPFFVAGEGHDGMHGPREHGTGAQMGEYRRGHEGGWFAYDGVLGQELTVNLCRNAIKRSDFVFAWIDSQTAHGTLVELGYAIGIGVPVGIAMPHCDCPEMGEDGHPRFQMLQVKHDCVVENVWFARQFAIQNGSRVKVAQEPLAALDFFVRSWQMSHARFDSEPERMFWEANTRLGMAIDDLITQHPVKVNGRNYRLDFYSPSKRCAIEVDGLEWHNGQASFVKDRSRQRDLEMSGIRVLRFAAKEVMDDSTKCVLQAAEWAAAV